MATIRERNGKYQVQVRRDGEAPRSKTFNLRSDAQAWARQTEVLLDQGLLKDTRQLKALTLSDLIARYILEVLPKKKVPHEALMLGVIQRESFSKRKLSGLTKLDLVRYRDRRLLSVKPSTLRRELNPLRHCFKVARSSWGIPVPDLLSGLNLPPEPRGRQRRLLPYEEGRLLNEVSPLLQAIVLFALETGARRGEILSSRWDEIDLDRREWTIHTSKNGDGRVIPLSLQAISVLSNLDRVSPSVFPLSGNALRLAFTRATKRAGISGLTFHDLRHEAISRLFEKGLSVTEVAGISGHRDIRMLLRYGHSDRARVLKILDNNCLSLGMP